MVTRARIAALIIGAWAAAMGILSAPRPYSLWPTVGHVASVLTGAVIGLFVLAMFHALFSGPESEGTTNEVTR